MKSIVVRFNLAQMFNLLVYLTIFLFVNFILITIVWNYYSTKIQLLITKKGEKEQVLGRCCFDAYVLVISTCRLCAPTESLESDA